MASNSLTRRFSELTEASPARRRDGVLRALDLVLSAFFLLVTLPLTIPIAVLNLLTSGRPLFYRGERPTFWCPVCETPLAEADIDYEERPSNLVWMKFPLASRGEIRIATTRPELLGACRAAMSLAPMPGNNSSKTCLTVLPFRSRGGLFFCAGDAVPTLEKNTTAAIRKMRLMAR